MPFDSLSILSQLQVLERQLAETPRLDQALRAAWAGGDRQAARCATAQAERHVRAMAITTGQLKAHVLPADGLESLSELALRAARIVVLAELNTLGELVCQHGSARPLSWGRFRSIEDLTACVRAELDRIAHLWKADHVGSGSVRPAYRAALQAAHTAMRKLGTASEVARFLWEGRRRTDWPALRALCIRISTVLTLRTDVAPDLPLVICHQLGAERGRGASAGIPENATRSPDDVGTQSAEQVDTFEAAVAELATCTGVLRSAIADVAFADAARLREALAVALSRTEALATHLPRGMSRAAAMHKLGALRGVAHDLLQIAPAPSVAAISAMEAGDRTLWDCEEQTWTAARLARGSAPRLPTLRRARSKTRPDTPSALRHASGAHRDGANAVPGTTPVAGSPPTAEEKSGP
jgi:hypothetical protein